MKIGDHKDSIACVLHPVVLRLLSAVLPSCCLASFSIVSRGLVPTSAIPTGEVVECVRVRPLHPANRLRRSV